MVNKETAVMKRPERPGLTACRPLVSVVIPTYNRAALLRRAVRSVLEQTFAEWELIIVDDGSTDHTIDVVKEFSDPRLRLIERSVKEGAACARNLGIEASCGEWVAFLDSDDEWLPRRLELQMNRLQNGPVDATVGYCLVLEHNELTQKARQLLQALNEGDVFDSLLRGSRPHTTSAYIVKRSVLLDVGGFDEVLPSGHDIDLWLRLAQKGNQFAAVNEALVIRHNDHGPQISNDPLALLRGFRRFDRKWGRVMRRRLGVELYWRWKFRRSRIIQWTLWRLVKEAFPNGHKILTLRHCLVMLFLLPQLVMPWVCLHITGRRTSKMHQG